MVNYNILPHFNRYVKFKKKHNCIIITLYFNQNSQIVYFTKQFESSISGASNQD